MSFLSFFPQIPTVTTASAAPVYHGGMIPCLGDVEPVNTRWLIKGYFPMVYLYDDQTMKVEFNCEDVIRRALEKYGA